MRREDRQGVGAAGTERAQYRLVHGAALPQSAGTGSVPGPAAVAVLHLAAPPRLLRLHVARLFAAHAVALATSEAPPTRRPPPAPRAPAPPRVPAPAAARTAPPRGRAPEAGCHSLPVLRVSVRSQQNGISSISQVRLFGICFSAGF